MRAGRSL